MRPGAARAVTSALVAAIATAAFANDWSLTNYVDDSGPKKKYCGNILDLYGTLEDWAHTIPASHIIWSEAKVGAYWNGSQYLMATEPSGAAASWVEHEWTQDASGDPKELWVSSNSDDPVASGSAAWLVALEQWWFNPSCQIDQSEPEVLAVSDGDIYLNVTNTGYQEDDPVYGTATSVSGGGGMGVQYAGVTGEGGSWFAEFDIEGLSMSPTHVKVNQTYVTTTSADCDNANVSVWKIAMDVELITQWQDD